MWHSRPRRIRPVPFPRLHARRLARRRVRPRSLVRLLTPLALAFLTACTPAAPGPTNRRPAGPGPEGMRVLATGLAAPWELTWGPDGWLWVTEKIGKRVDRINPVDDTRTVALTVDDVAASGAQDGLLGLAFADDWAFVAYSYNIAPP